MLFKKDDLLMQVIIKGITGAFAGIIGGFVLGLLIWGLSCLAAKLGSTMNNYGDFSQNFYPALEQVTTMGMMVGGFLGAIFGSMAGFKEKK